MQSGCKRIVAGDCIRSSQPVRADKNYTSSWRSFECLSILDHFLGSAKCSEMFPEPCPNSLDRLAVGLRKFSVLCKFPKHSVQLYIHPEAEDRLVHLGTRSCVSEIGNCNGTENGTPRQLDATHHLCIHCRHCIPLYPNTNCQNTKYNQDRQ